jgi:hypothetical protein
VSLRWHLADLAVEGHGVPPGVALRTAPSDPWCDADHISCHYIAAGLAGS